EARLIDQIAHALRVKSTCRGFRENRRAVRVGSGKPLAAWAECSDDLGIAIHDPILAVDPAPKVGVQSNASVVGRPCDTTGETGLELCQSADLPTSEQLASQRGVILEEWQVVKVVEDQDVASVEFRGPPEHAGVVGVWHDVTLIGTVVHPLRVGI